MEASSHLASHGLARPRVARVSSLICAISFREALPLLLVASGWGPAVSFAWLLARRQTERRPSKIVPPLVLYSHIATTMNVPQVCFVKDATDERARDVLGFRGHHRAHCPARCAHRARRARLHVHSRRARPRDH